MVQSIWKTGWQYLLKLIIYKSYDPTILLLGPPLPQREKHAFVQKDMDKNVHSSLIHNNKKLRATWSPSIVEWINCDVWTLKYYTVSLPIKCDYQLSTDNSIAICSASVHGTAEDYFFNMNSTRLLFCFFWWVNFAIKKSFYCCSLPMYTFWWNRVSNSVKQSED